MDGIEIKFIFLACLLAEALAQSKVDLAGTLPTNKTGNLNEYVDEVIGEAVDKFPEYNIDPMFLPNFMHGVQHRVWFLTFNGGIATSNGLVMGLKTLHRSGDATLQVDEATQIMHLDGSLAARNLHISADVHAWYSFLNADIHAKGKAEYMRASVEFQVPTEGDDIRPEATRVAVEDINGFRLEIGGLGPLNWLAERIVHWYTGDIKEFINSRFGKMALDAINSQIGSIVAPTIVPSPYLSIDWYTNIF